MRDMLLVLEMPQTGSTLNERAFSPAFAQSSTWCTTLLQYKFLGDSPSRERDQQEVVRNSRRIDPCKHLLDMAQRSHTAHHHWSQKPQYLSKSTTEEQQFSRACSTTAKMSVHPSAKIHPTAIVDCGATIGAASRVWHWVHICSGAKIGEHCSLGQNVFVGDQVIIGNNVKIQNNVSIYDGVILEDDVFCGPSMVFTNVYNPRSAVSRRDEYRETVVEKGVTLGANCTIVCGTRIGRHAFVGAGAVVNRDVKPFSLMVGVPARQIGWMSAYGERVDLPLEGTGSWTCPNTGELYQLANHQLTKTPS
jgi:UDP-2-acetamido-3-amino-2,3-dideoxy-glucuronate N-acetyltransferase